ncbi:MAG: hypothetical protein ACT4PW_10100 [Acidimicrobiia bacterium]
MNKLIASVVAAGTLGAGAFALNAVAPVGAADRATEAAPVLGGCGARPGAVLADALDALVRDGTLSQAQADAVVTEVRERAVDATDRPGPRRPGLLHGALEVAARTIGIPVDELRQGLQDGQSTADVATAHGVSPQAVVDAIVADGQARLDEAVADGRLSDEHAARAGERLAERAAGLVERAC